ncbi:MAG: GNAT family N-acetyltransferase [Patescibacteria group bacterium]|jgi:predicted acetyltransferase
MELVEPNVRYKQSFIDAVKEYQAVESPYRRDIYELKVADLEKDFEVYVTHLLKESRGENLPPDRVPQSTFWLVDGEKIIGRVAIRHELTDYLLREGGHVGYDIRPSMRGKGLGKKLLELALKKAKEIGLQKVLVTCSVENTPSKKVIEANGGMLENAIQSDPNKPATGRYWITLSSDF